MFAALESVLRCQTFGKEARGLFAGWVNFPDGFTGIDVGTETERNTRE